MLRRAKPALIAVAALLAGAVAPAMGADYFEPPIVEAPPPIYVEEKPSYGGWYIRGDIDYSWLKFRGAEYTVIDPILNCCGQMVGARLVGGNALNGKLRPSFSLGAGVGYKISKYLRADLTLDYQFRSRFNGYTVGCGGACRSTDVTSLTALSLLANAYADLGTYKGITPYVGAGIGGAHIKWEDLSNTACNGGVCNTFTHPGYKELRFAYALMAGVSYDITSSVALDVGYRWMRVPGGRMFGGDNAPGGPYTGHGRDKGIDFHSVKAGLRYKFGGGYHAKKPDLPYYEPEPIVYK